MAGSSRKAQDLKAKEAKQKKILAVGLVLLVILMVVQMPKLLHHGPPAAAAPPPPTPAVPAGTAAPTDLNPPVVADGTNPTAATSSSALADTDVAPAPADGTLVQFDMFASKDPFVQQVQEVAAGSGEAPAGGSGGGSKASGGAGSGGGTDGSGGGIGTGGAAAPPKTPSGPTEPVTAVARLTFDGTAEQVVAGGDFPAASPVFHLASFDAREARISVLGGQYQDGSATLKLARGKAVTLQNTADGTRYRIVYLGRAKVPTSSLAQAAPAQPTTTAPAATTPTQTPTTPAVPTAPALPTAPAAGSAPSTGQ
jgi:hypothetical protein